jgi:putative salt-induced outer membrane protein YdiY
MKNIRLALLILLLIVFQPTIHARADQITLINGDQISGEILVISDNKIRLVTEYAGEIEVDFDKVESLCTDKTVSIALTNGDLINGKVDSISEDQIIIVSEAFGVIEVHRSLFESLNETGPSKEDLVELEQTQEELAETEAALTRAKEDIDKKEQEIEELSLPLNLWSGSFAFGVKLERGNSDSNGKADTNNVFSSTKLKVFQSERRYFFGTTSLEYDEFEDLDLRAQAFVGPGYYFIKKKKTDLFGEIGGGIVGEFIDDEDETVEGNAYLHIGWRQKIFENSEFIQDITLLPDLSDVGDYRVRSETTLRTPVGERWALKLTILDDYDSNPEGKDIDKNDVTFVSGLEYSF